MHEASKAAQRRGREFKYIKGSVIDIGCGLDPILNLYDGITNFHPWDLEDGDGQYLKGMEDMTFDCAHSSHSLEHMENPHVALTNWVRVVRPGGYLVVTVPDEEMYERLRWPSVFNPDHRVSFTTGLKRLPKSINILELLFSIKDIQVISILRIEDNFNPSIPGDQTLGKAECCIEFILRRNHERINHF